MPLGGQFVAKSGGTAVLPNDSVVDGFSSSTVPDERRFALVGNPNSRNLCGRYLSLAQHGTSYTELGIPDLRSIVFDPSRLGKDLSKLLLRYRNNFTFPIEEDCSGTRRALIKRKDIFFHS